MLEREVKLAADAGVVLPDLAAAIAGLTVRSASTVHLDAVYYDTPTLSLARSGVTLRSRTGEPGAAWTLKLPVTTEGSKVSRHELTFDEPIGQVPVSVSRAARGYVRSQTLGPAVRLHTERTQVPLEVDGSPLATLCDDRVVVNGPVEPTAVFREIEVELAEGSERPEAIEVIVSCLLAAGCTIPDAPVGKAIRALGPQALEPPDVVIPKLGKRPTVEDVVCHSLATSVSQLIRHHAGTFEGNDPEDLHQFRVAARRLRSDLRTFRSLVDDEWARYLSDELKWLGGEVGIGRDAQVLAAHLRAQLSKLPEHDVGSVNLFLQRLSETTRQASDHVVATVTSDRYVSLLDDLVEASRHPVFAVDPPGLPDRQARPRVKALVRAPWRRLNRAVKALTPDAPDAEFHEARILAKRARYAVDAVQPVFGRDARRFARALGEIQTVLGDHQDTVVAEAWLRETAKGLPSTRIVAGELIILERNDRARLRAEFPSVWKNAKRPKLRKWLNR